MVVVILLTIVMGIIDFGIFARNSLSIANAAREGARTASIGRTVAQIRERVKIVANPLVVSDANIELTYLHPPATTYAPLTDNGTENVAVADDLVRVNVSYRNASVTGAFGLIFNRTIRTAVIMRRERSIN